jgi:lysophospholipase L1-like esterase
MTQPCADSGEQPNGQPWPEDSPARIATYNAIVRAVAARTGAAVQDLFAMVCPNRTFEEEIDGIRVRSPDGVHFARSGGPYLAPRVFPLLTVEGRLAQSATG